MPPGCEDSPRPNIAERLPPDSDQGGEPSEPEHPGPRTRPWPARQGPARQGPGPARPDTGKARHRQGRGTAGRVGHRQGRAPARPDIGKARHRQGRTSTVTMGSEC